MRVRLKADGRIVEICADGSERPIAQEAAPPAERFQVEAARPLVAGLSTTSVPIAPVVDAAYARGVRAQTRLTQAEFAARIGVPIETVRNWEQGKRSPRGPARALLKVIERAPDVAFAVLSRTQPER